MPPISQQYFDHLCRRHLRRTPNDEVLGALCESLGVRPSYFADDAYEPFDACHFRRASKTPKGVRQEAHARGAFFQRAVRWLDERVSWPDVDVPEIQAAGSAAIEAAAEECRRRWGLCLDEPLADVIYELEGHGIIVTEFNGLSDTIDAFSRWWTRPLIVLTMSKGSTSRCVWNLGHELGHLVLHRRSDATRKVLEAEANRFAGAFLLPRAGFLREFPRANVLRPHRLLSMKKRWKVSVAAIVRRAHDLELIGAREYRSANVWLRAHKWHRGEPDEPALERPALLADAFAVLADDGVRWCDVANELSWSSKQLERVTGVPAPSDEPVSGGDVVPFRRSARS